MHSHPAIPRSFSAYILSRRAISARSGADTWRFVAYASGDDGIRAAGDWIELKAMLCARDAPEELRSAARKVWRSYERWRGAGRVWGAPA